MRRSRSGQSTVEYLMTISVIVIAIAAAMAGFYTVVTDETAATGSSMATSLTSGGVQ
jgi:uncharacterized protein (UPF0333 family)